MAPKTASESWWHGRGARLVCDCIEEALSGPQSSWPHRSLHTLSEGTCSHWPTHPPSLGTPGHQASLSPSSFNFKILHSPSLPRDSRDLQPSVRNPEAEGTLRAPPFTEGSLKIGLPNTVRSSLSPPLYRSVNRGSKTNNFSKRGPV